MKIYTYQPGSGSIAGAVYDDTDPLDALAKIILRHDSLDTAIKELQRKGVRGDDGSKLFFGIKDLLEELRQKKKQALHELGLADMDSGALDKISEFAEALPYGSDARATFRESVSAMPEATLALAQYLDDRLNRDTQKLSVREACLMAGKIKDMDRLEKSLHSLRWSTQFDALDEELLEKAMGSEALAKWQAIRNLPMRLLEQGLVAAAGPISCLRLRACRKPHGACCATLYSRAKTKNFPAG